jgi:hypothetical protein
VASVATIVVGKLVRSMMFDSCQSTVVSNSNTRVPLVRITSWVRVDLLYVYLERMTARGPSVMNSLDWTANRPAGRSR